VPVAALTTFITNPFTTTAFVDRRILGGVVDDEGRRADA
jgi:hypothetical protein